MEPGLLRDALTLVAGVLTGVLSAAFGVGGAVVSTPAIRALGLPAALAVGTTLPSIIPSAATGTRRYVRESLEDGEWKLTGLHAPRGEQSVAQIAAAIADHDRDHLAQIRQGLAD